VVVLDESMPERSGLSAVKEFQQARPCQIVILCSAYLDADMIDRARRMGVSAWLDKHQMHALPDLIRSVVAGKRSA
jgi:DNA-binding NarL/FixJ family response regulator